MLSSQSHAASSLHLPKTPDSRSAWHWQCSLNESLLVFCLCHVSLHVALRGSLWWTEIPHASLWFVPECFKSDNLSLQCSPRQTTVPPGEIGRAYEEKKQLCELEAVQFYSLTSCAFLTKMGHAGNHVVEYVGVRRTSCTQRAALSAVAAVNQWDFCNWSWRFSLEIQKLTYSL